MHRLLFIPASGPKGTGEYFRSLNIARILVAQRDDLDIMFLLSRESAGASHCPFPKILLPNTPTFCQAEVTSAIDSFAPDLVVFDATGRSSQVKLAHRAGARTLFIAQNNRILSRGLGLKRLGATDEIWIAQPEFMLPLTGYNRLKARLAGIPVIHIGPVFPVLTDDHVAQTRECIPFLDEPFILLNPGGGGHMIENVPSGKIFEDLAGKLYRQTGVPVLLVYGPNYDGLQKAPEGVLAFAALEPEIFNVVVKYAGAFVSGGGGALFQAAAYKVPTWAMSLSGDQDKRIEALGERYDFIHRYITFENLLTGIGNSLNISEDRITFVDREEEVIRQRINRLLN